MLSKLISVLGISFIALNGCSTPASPPNANGGNPPVWDTLRTVWRVPKPFEVGILTSSHLRPSIVEDSFVLFGFGEGFACLNANTGAVVWKTELGIGHEPWDATDVVVEDAQMYALAGNDALGPDKASIVCLSIHNGSIVWRHDLASGDRFAWGWTKYGVSSNAIYYATMSSHVVALSKVDGSVLWDVPNGSVKPLNFPIYQGQATYRNGVVYVCSGFSTPDQTSDDGGITALDASTGKVLWQIIMPSADSTSGYPNPKLLNNNRLVTAPLPTNDGIIVTPGYCIALVDSTGRVVWLKAPNVTGGLSIYTWQPFLDNGKLFAYNNGNGNFFALSMDAHTGMVNWARNDTKFPETELFNTPFLDSGLLCEVSDDGAIWGQSTLDGSLVFWTPLIYYTDHQIEDAVTGQCLVNNNRVYYQTDNALICIERK